MNTNITESYMNLVFIFYDAMIHYEDKAKEVDKL
ncbi:hypothetical protein B0P06_001604 [Clostridium saccharoperbutylacetonicum]|nr:hypothetical protein [Clostridium saccharoperbutylacetonicum]